MVSQHTLFARNLSKRAIAANKFLRGSIIGREDNAKFSPILAVAVMVTVLNLKNNAKGNAGCTKDMVSIRKIFVEELTNEMINTSTSRERVQFSRNRTKLFLRSIFAN